MSFSDNRRAHARDDGEVVILAHFVAQPLAVGDQDLLDLAAFLDQVRVDNVVRDGEGSVGTPGTGSSSSSLPTLVCL